MNEKQENYKTIYEVSENKKQIKQKMLILQLLI